MAKKDYSKMSAAALKMMLTTSKDPATKKEIQAAIAAKEAGSVPAVETDAEVAVGKKPAVKAKTPAKTASKPAAKGNSKPAKPAAKTPTKTAKKAEPKKEVKPAAKKKEAPVKPAAKAKSMPAKKAAKPVTKSKSTGKSQTVATKEIHAAKRSKEQQEAYPALAAIKAKALKNVGKKIEFIPYRQTRKKKATITDVTIRTLENAVYYKAKDREGNVFNIRIKEKNEFTFC